MKAGESPANPATLSPGVAEGSAGFAAAALSPGAASFGGVGAQKEKVWRKKETVYVLRDAGDRVEVWMHVFPKWKEKRFEKHECGAFIIFKNGEVYEISASIDSDGTWMRRTTLKAGKYSLKEMLSLVEEIWKQKKIEEVSELVDELVDFVWENLRVVDCEGEDCEKVWEHEMHRRECYPFEEDEEW